MMRISRKYYICYVCYVDTLSITHSYINRISIIMSPALPVKTAPARCYWRILAATIAEITPILRIDKGDHYLISKALEIGAGGILVPDISSREEGEELIKAAKFPPKGSRGYSSFCFSGQWGARGVRIG